MTRKEEILDELVTLREALNTITDVNAKKLVQETIDKLEIELAQVDPTPMPTPNQPATPTSYSQTALATLRATMMGGQGSGVDSVQVRKIIEDYLVTDKVNLTELDNDVMEFIKANQKVILELPNFGGFKIEVSKRDSEIPYFFEVIDDVLAGNNVYLIGEAGGGKASPLYTKVLSDKGWITFADVKEGDKVFGEDGKLYEINGVFDRGEKSVYRVFMNDGGFVDTCDEHLWKIYTRNDRGKGNDGRVLPLKEFMNKIKIGDNNANAYIDINKAIEFDSISHKINPYTLGVILGDGSISQTSLSICNPSKELFDSLVLPEGIELVERESENRCLTYGLVRTNMSLPNPLKEELIRLKLHGKKSIHKFIPEEYLYDSIENRIALLQGLNDTDAYSDNTHFEFCTSSECLANDYCELVRSLGGTAKKTEKTPYYNYNGVKKEGHTAYRIFCVFPDEIQPFKLTYKKDRYKKPTKYGIKRFIDKVEYVGELETRCISVTNPTHLYITDDYIVTHNTYTAEEVAKKLKREYLIINCSQYTSPTEILGGQTIEGYKEGKLINAWRDGKILILDEMPRLDPNTAGLFNDALAKSSKTRESKNAMISSTNPEEAPIPRNENFALIGTGNIYPNTAPPKKYKANNQQDLSLLDRFSGSVYKVEYSKPIDELTSRFKFLYEMLVGNYYEYTEAIKNNQTPPEAKGLRTILKDLSLDDLAVVSYRTLVSFRVAFEIELVRAIAKSEGKDVGINKGKTLQKAFDSFLVAFDKTTVDIIITKSKFTPAFIKSKVDETIKEIINGNMVSTLNDSVANSVSSIFKKYSDFFVAEKIEP